MNFKLSTYANRVKGKRCFILMRDGKIIAEKISKFDGDNIKENALACISQGLCATKNVISHEDLLLIEVQNSHLCHWLDGSIENKEYSDGLDKVFAQIEGIDCRYRYLLNAKPIAKTYMENKGITQVKTIGVDDLMSEFSEGDN